MDPVTDNQMPEPGAFEKFGAWLEAFSAVPPWLEWIVVWLTIVTAVGFPIVRFVWPRWGANWWAARSKNAAERRAGELVVRVAQVHANSKNWPAMLSHLAVFFAGCVLVSTGIILGVIVAMNLHLETAKGLPPSDALVTARSALVLLLAITSYILSAVLLVWFNEFFAPLSDIDEFTLRSRKRIEGLFTKAGVPQQVASRRLKEFDAQVDAARNQEIR